MENAEFYVKQYAGIENKDYETPETKIKRNAFVDGFNKAKELFELKWEDFKNIDLILGAVEFELEEDGLEENKIFSNEEFYTKVLDRFYEKKFRKNQSN